MEKGSWKGDPEKRGEWERTSGGQDKGGYSDKGKDAK